MVLERSTEVKDKRDEARDTQSREPANMAEDRRERDDESSRRDGNGAKTKRESNRGRRMSTGATEKAIPHSTPVKKVTVAQLRQRLQELNLPITGKKAELESRLRLYHGGETDEGDPIEDKDGESSDNESDDQARESRESSDVSDEDGATKVRARNIRIGSLNGRDVAARRETTRGNAREGGRHPYGAASLFTIKDIEGSISHFSGDDAVQVERWIDEFEDMSALLEWNDLQMVIYAKKLLRGSAKQYIALQKGIKTWRLMKQRLVREFTTKINSAIVHEQLTKRKRLDKETPRQYVYAMSTIADQGSVEEEALIQYIIDGIADDENSKSILYNSNTITELRKNLERYDRMKEKSEKKPRKDQMKNRSKEIGKDDRKPRRKNDGDVRCFGCGAIDHVARDCPDREKGPKCFKCNKFGHVAAKCEEPEKLTTKKSNKTNAVNMIEQLATDDEVIVEINDVKVQSMIDTGTNRTMLRRSEYEKIGRPTLRSTTSTFQGFGNALVKADGVLRPDLKIHGETYDTDIYVVPDYAMRQSMLLGKELTRQMDINIRGGQVSIRKLTTAEKKTEDIKKEDNAEEKENNQDSMNELPFAKCIEVNSVDVVDRYREKIEKLIENHVPRKEVQTDVETKIVLQDEAPVCLRPRRLAIKEKDILSKQIDEWLRDGIIQPSKSKYASPVVIVPKKNGEHRVCIDYRQLNKKIIRDRFPMPLIDDRIDALANARVFSVLDLKNGFFHVPVAADSRKYTSFVTPDGQYEFLKTPFGLCNSPTSFLRFIDEVFHDLSRRNVVFTYVDDLIVPGRDEDEALMNLTETLAVAADKGLSLNWNKCKFLQRRVEYLGHVIENGNVGPSPSKIISVKNFPPPSSKKAVQSFLGLTGYFRKFVRDYAKIARPLSEMLKDNQKFRFGAEEEHAFERLKRALTTEPILRIYRPDAITELHTDASKEGYGAALLQKNENEDRFHAVYFMSRKTTDAEKKLHSYELETLAVVQAVKKFRVYLLGIKFKLITDCSALQKTLGKMDIAPKVARWALMLEEFEYEVEHRAGARLKHVDALSRYPVMVIDDKITPVIRKQQDDEERLRVIKQILKKEPYEDYVCENGILMKRVGGKNVVVLPTNMQQEVIRKTHENGHFGVKKMLESLKSEYYIPKLTEKLEKFVSCCVPCILAEGKRGKKEGMLRPIPKGDMPLSTYHVDHLGPMTTTSKLYKHLFVVVDGFSKFVWIYPTKTTNAKEVLDRLKGQQKIFGNPQRIVSDRGTAFTSNDFQSYCAKENIEHVLITTGVPRGNGQVERINRIIIPVLTKFAQDCPDKWYKHVDKIQRAINSTYQRSVGTSPFEVLFGVKMRQKENVELLSLIEQETVALFDNEREELRAIAKENIAKIQQENKKSYDRKCKPATQYRVGDLVAIKRTQFGSGLKIKNKYLGPYKISQVKGNDRYEMIRQGDYEGPGITTSSADQMKRYEYDSPGSGE